jgi:phosphate transport system substrate-binding protein
MSHLKLSTAAVAVLAISAVSAAAQTRDTVQVAGSSTVLPYATIVAEAFGENFDFPTPVVESGGSSTGLRRFCEGVGENTTDIANSSRLDPRQRDRDLRRERRHRHHRSALRL